MKRIAILTFLFALVGCNGAASPTPSELANNFQRYDDRQITTCGQIITGGGKCTLQTDTKEIWVSTKSQLCAAQASSTTYAKVSGLFSVLDSGAEPVIRKASIEPLHGGCPASGT